MQDEELKDDWIEYRPFFDSFVLMVDARYGHLIHLPFEGGMLDQPHHTMEIYRLILEEFRKKLSSEFEKAARKK